MSPSRPILRLFLINWALGILLGCAFATAMLVFNVSGIGSLIARSDMAVAATLLLYVGFSVTCGGVVCASAVMRMVRDEDLPPSGAAEFAEPAVVRIGARR